MLSDCCRLSLFLAKFLLVYLEQHKNAKNIYKVFSLENDVVGHYMKAKVIIILEVQNDQQLMYVA
jgi:hypothetical protein